MEVLTQSAPISFEDTATAFEAQSNRQLTKTYWLFLGNEQQFFS